MKSLKSQDEKGVLTVARTVYPEDLSVGDNVVVAEVTYEVGTFAWCGADLTVRPPEDPIRIPYRPHDEHHPMTVKRVCLPYVLCKTLEKKHRVVDLRQVKLALVDPDFAEAVRVGYKADRKPKKRDGKKKSKKRKKRKT